MTIEEPGNGTLGGGVQIGQVFGGNDDEVGLSNFLQR